MNTEVTPRLLRFAAERCCFPGVTIGTVPLTDKGAWDHAIKRSTPGERATLLAALQDALLAVSEAGRSRGPAT